MGLTRAILRRFLHHGLGNAKAGRYIRHGRPLFHEFLESLEFVGRVHGRVHVRRQANFRSVRFPGKDRAGDRKVFLHGTRLRKALESAQSEPSVNDGEFAPLRFSHDQRFQ
jgi:hypothetical protein